MRSFIPITLAAALLCCHLSPATAASWAAAGLPESGSIVSVGITAVKGTADACVIAGAPSGGSGPSAGPHTYGSSDFGETFTPSQPVGEDIMLLSVAAAPGNAANICVGGIVGVHHTADGGKTWALSAGGPSASQSLVGFGTGSFGAAFQGGVAVSADAGKTFTKHATGLNTTLYPARYAAFPSATTWYVSHGTFSTSASASTRVHLSDSVALDAAGRYQFSAPAPGAGGDGYAAALSKTTDGGKTFTKQFSAQGEYYFNDIHCATTEHCIAVAEGHNVPQPGAHIFVTSDGGAHWNNTFSLSGQASLMGVRDLDGKEGWAVGGTGFTALFLHTTDGGMTWANEPVSGLHCLGVDFASAANGYAICLNALRQTQVAVFK